MNHKNSAWLAALALSALGIAPLGAQSTAKKINHVFVLVLENEGYDTTFGSGSKSPYLAQTLPAQGALLRQYYGTGHASLDNYIAMISGQAASNETRADCQTYQDFNLTGTTADGQAIGSGCIYPASVLTVADQLAAASKTWKAYMGDMGNDPKRESATCGHPDVNSADLTQSAEAPSTSVPKGDFYATRHNPFAYFHSIIDSPSCNTNVVALSKLTTDLQTVNTTPNYVFITPNLCDDGHDAPCADGRPGGLTSIDAFLRQWVPAITSSPAYQQDGLFMIVFDEGGFDATVPDGKGGYIISADGQFCCNQKPGPNLAAFPQSSTISIYTLNYNSFGGDRTGAVLLSPFIEAGIVNDVPFNHYSMLKTVEEIFGLDYLGYANSPGLVGFFGCVTSGLDTASGLAKCK